MRTLAGPLSVVQWVLRGGPYSVGIGRRESAVFENRNGKLRVFPDDTIARA